MMDVLTRADPAADLAVDAARLRARVDERTAVTASRRSRAPRRAWVRTVTAFAAVLILFVPAYLATRDPDPEPVPFIGEIDELAGVDAAIGLDGGGVKTMAVDGNGIWVMNALARTLDLVDPATRRVTDTYPIDAYVEGVVVGGGRVWLMSYDDGGEVLLFDTDARVVTKTFRLGSFVTRAVWFADRLWVGTDDGALRTISVSGEVTVQSPARLLDAADGRLWVDPGTGLVTSMDADGDVGEIVVPDGDGLVPSPTDIWRVAHDGRELWLLDPAGVVIRFDPVTGDLRSLPVTPGLRDIVFFDGAVWVTSMSDHLLGRIEPDSDDITFHALPGKPGGMLVTDGDLWVALHQPGALVRVDPAELPESGPRIVDDVADGHRLLCTGPSAGASQAVVVLDASSWIEYGSWSMVQAELAGRGITACSHGYLDTSEGLRPPATRAADLERALERAGIAGPYVLVAGGDGVHSTRLFAEGRDDVVGLVLVDPMPLGFQTFYDEILPGWGHPPWSDLDPAIAASLSDFGDTPLAVIGQDPERAYLNPRMREHAGEDTARLVDRFWKDGLATYAAMSSNSSIVVAHGSAMDWILWERPDVVVSEIDGVLDRIGSGTN